MYVLHDKTWHMLNFFFSKFWSSVAEPSFEGVDIQIHFLAQKSQLVRRGVRISVKLHLEIHLEKNEKIQKKFGEQLFT